MLKLYAINARRIQRLRMRRLVFATLLLTVIFFAGLLTGCGETLPKIQQGTPKLPSKPDLTTPLPSVPYSQTVREKLESWRSNLTGM